MRNSPTHVGALCEIALRPPLTVLHKATQRPFELPVFRVDHIAAIGDAFHAPQLDMTLRRIPPISPRVTTFTRHRS